MANDTQPPKLFVPGVAGLYEWGKPLAYPWIRFMAGAFLAPHGMQKMLGLWGGNFDGTVQFFNNVGLSPGWLWVNVVGLTELIGGILIAIGLFTRVAAAGAAILLLVAALVVHLPNGFFWGGRGYEYPLLWCFIFVAIFFRGGGKLSIDSAIGREF